MSKPLRAAPRPHSVLILHRATRFIDRLCGLHAYPPLADDTGLFLAPCRAVHTFGLRYSIDVVFLDRHELVVKRVDALPPSRVAWCASAVAVVELPGGYCRTWPDYAFAIRAALARACAS